MRRRYLFGPLASKSFADENLRGQRQRGDCLTFGPGGGVDVVVSASDSWKDIVRRLPDGWQPDFVVLWLPYTHIPSGLWQAPVPLVSLAADWNLLWHSYRRRLRRCDWVLTDAAGVEALGREGLTQVRQANLFGRPRSLLEGVPAEGARDIDVLFVGNLSPAVQRQRQDEPWSTLLTPAHVAVK